MTAHFSEQGGTGCYFLRLSPFFSGFSKTILQCIQNEQSIRTIQIEKKIHNFAFKVAPYFLTKTKLGILWKRAWKCWNDLGIRSLLIFPDILQNHLQNSCQHPYKGSDKDFTQLRTKTAYQDFCQILPRRPQSLII